MSLLLSIPKLLWESCKGEVEGAGHVHHQRCGSDKSKWIDARTVPSCLLGGGEGKLVATEGRFAAILSRYYGYICVCMYRSP